jgi:hypothetical protein
MISSAMVAALAYSFTPRAAYLATRPPPTAKIAIMVGTMQHRIRANFQLLKNAMTKAEKNDPRDEIINAI